MQRDFQRWSDDMEDDHSLDTQQAVASVFGSHFKAIRSRTTHENENEKENLLLVKRLEGELDIG